MHRIVPYQGILRIHNLLFALYPSYCSRILKLLHGDGHICRNRRCSCFVSRYCVADRYILTQSKTYRIVVAWLRIGCWFFVGEIERPPSTERALKDVLIADSTSFQGRGKALQFPMQIRYRELKRASMDNQNWELCWLFQSEKWKLSISTSRSFFKISDGLARRGPVYPHTTNMKRLWPTQQPWLLREIKIEYFPFFPWVTLVS